jgi:hypothetical protein
MGYGITVLLYATYSMIYYYPHYLLMYYVVVYIFSTAALLFQLFLTNASVYIDRVHSDEQLKLLFPNQTPPPSRRIDTSDVRDLLLSPYRYIDAASAV